MLGIVVLVAGALCAGSAVLAQRYELLGMVVFVLLATFVWRPHHVAFLRRDRGARRPASIVDGLLLWLAVALIPTVMHLLQSADAF